VLSAFQPNLHDREKPMCMEVIYPGIRADSPSPGPARTETLNCVSHYQFGWYVTYRYADDVAPILPAGTIIRITGCQDNLSFAWLSLFYLDEVDYQQRIEERTRMHGQKGKQ
jgi:hypothetical protein